MAEQVPPVTSGRETASLYTFIAVLAGALVPAFYKLMWLPMLVVLMPAPFFLAFAAGVESIPKFQAWREVGGLIFGFTTALMAYGVLFAGIVPMRILLPGKSNISNVSLMLAGGGMIVIAVAGHLFLNTKRMGLGKAIQIGIGLLVLAAGSIFINYSVFTRK